LDALNLMTLCYLETSIIDIFTDNNYRALDIILMDVPCCQGFINITHSAMEKCNKSIPTTITTIGIDGTIKK